MSPGWRRGSAGLFAGALGIVVLFAAGVEAQVIHPDQMIGSPSPLIESLPEGGSTSHESAAGDLEKGFDRQMMAPETGSFGGMDTNVLKTPDATDAENARESDSQSAVSF